MDDNLLSLFSSNYASSVLDDKQLEELLGVLISIGGIRTVQKVIQTSLIMHKLVFPNTKETKELLALELYYVFKQSIKQNSMQKLNEYIRSRISKNDTITSVNVYDLKSFIYYVDKKSKNNRLYLLYRYNSMAEDPTYLDKFYNNFIPLITKIKS